jgi:hypothetical protein
MPNGGCPHTELIFQHDRDLYRGNGKPGVTIRLEKIEDRMDSMEKALDRRETKQNIILGAVLSLVGLMIAKYIFHI